MRGGSSCLITRNRRGANMRYSTLIKSSAKFIDACLKRDRLLHDLMAYSDFNNSKLSALLPLPQIQRTQGDSKSYANYKESYTSSEIARLEQVLHNEGICSSLVLESAAQAYLEQRFHLKNSPYGFSFIADEFSDFWIEPHIYLYSWRSPYTISSTEKQLIILIKTLCEGLLARGKLITHQRIA